MDCWHSLSYICLFGCVGVNEQGLGVDSMHGVRAENSIAAEQRTPSLEYLYCQFKVPWLDPDVEAHVVDVTFGYP